MSRNGVNNPYPDWGHLNSELLWYIFQKLDVASLCYCMYVNKYWRNEVEDRWKNDEDWQKVVDKATNWKTSVFRDKSSFDDKNITISASFWHIVKNATLSLHHRYEFKDIRDICVFKDNLIVTSDNGVDYYNIDVSQLLRTEVRNHLLSNINHYVETPSFIVKITSPKLNLRGHNTFTVLNKLHMRKCDCAKPPKCKMSDVIYWRVDNDSCYAWNKEHVLVRYTPERCKWTQEFLAFYECSHDYVLGLNIYRENTYLFVKNNSDRVSGSSKNIYKIPITLPDSIKPCLFNTFSVLCAVAPQNQHINVQSLGEHMIVTCPGVSSATEHGPMLILGYKDGKIQIFRRDELSRGNLNPELQFYFQHYIESPSRKIIAIDVFEARDRHHLFVATESNIYEFYLNYE